VAYKWIDMTPRERGALIADKVMGWKWLEDIDDEYSVFATDDNPYNNRVVGHNFCPDESILYAWEVLEHMREQGCWVAVSDARNKYKAVFMWSEPKLGEAFAKTAPEAICLAALRAVGVDVE
jgi:hypothetical protein